MQREREKVDNSVTSHHRYSERINPHTVNKSETPMGMIAILFFYTIAKDIDVWERGNTTVYIHISRRATTIFKD